MLEGDLEEVANGVVAACGQDKIVGLVGLQHAPHAFDVLGGIAPVTNGVQVAHVEQILFAGLDGGYRAGDLARDKSFAAPGRLVVEEDPVHCVHSVRFTVVLGDPVAVDLRSAVGGPRIERSVLVLRGRRGAEHLGGGRLVELGLNAGHADGLEEPDGADSRGVGGVLRFVKGNTNVRLGRQVVDLVRLDLGQQRDQARAVAQVAVVKEQLGLRIVRIDVKVINSCRVERRGPADEPVNFVSLC